MSYPKKALIAVIIAWILGIALFNALALTPIERKKAQFALDAVNQGIEHGKILQAAAEQARIEASNANAVAMMAATSAFTTGVKAKSALDEAARCKKENAEMRPIVERWKKLQGPWWFHGLNGLFYFAGRSLLSLVIIIVVGFVLFLVIKIVLTVVTGGTWGAGLGAVTEIFGALGRWFGRAGKRLLSFLTRRGKSAVDNIEHRTIGSEPDDS